MIQIKLLIGLLFFVGVNLKSDNESFNHELIKERRANSDSTLRAGWYYLENFDNGFKRTLLKSNEFYFINPTPIVTVDNFIKVELIKQKYSKDHYFLSIKLDKDGTQNWSIATEKSINKKLAFIMDDNLLYVTEIYSRVDDGITTVNRNSYSKTELEIFKEIIQLEKKK